MYGAVIRTHLWRVALRSSSLSAEKSKIFGGLGNSPRSRLPIGSIPPPQPCSDHLRRFFAPYSWDQRIQTAAQPGTNCSTSSAHAWPHDFIDCSDFNSAFV